jgi:hypothetical protein
MQQCTLYFFLPRPSKISASHSRFVISGLLLFWNLKGYIACLLYTVNAKNAQCLNES